MDIAAIVARIDGRQERDFERNKWCGLYWAGLNNTYFNGEISEILVYNRILTADETATVESYLRNKFGTR
jgi:hypothetical protein